MYGFIVTVDRLTSIFDNIVLDLIINSLDSIIDLSKNDAYSYEIILNSISLINNEKYKLNGKLHNMQGPAIIWRNEYTGLPVCEHKYINGIRIE